jgi:hypothetical protein
MSDTITITDIVNDYIAAWNEDDPSRRRDLVASALAPDVQYVDPLMAGAGRRELEALIAGAQAQYPGHAFVLADGPDQHHDRVRFTWHLRGPAGATVAVGLDVATLADDGRLRDITGFLDLP